jgi:uncharacterized protein
MKYVVAGLIIAALLAWLARTRAKPPAQPPPSKPTGTQTPASPSAAAGAAQPASMLRCAHCGVHLPGSDAVVVRGTAYCSDEHRQQAETRSS